MSMVRVTRVAGLTVYMDNTDQRLWIRVEDVARLYASTTAAELLRVLLEAEDSRYPDADA